MAEFPPMLLGVEDTLVIAAAHQRAEPKLTLDNFCAHVDALVEQGLGNLYAVRGYMLHPEADPGEILKSKQCVTDDPDGDLVKLLEYAAQRGVYSMTIYTAMTKRVVSALKRRCGKYYLGNNLGEVTSAGAPAGQLDMRRAARTWVKGVGAAVRRQWKLGQPHVTCTLTNYFAKYCMEAGMDFPTGEIFTTPCVDVHWALLRGAARAYGGNVFAGWIAAGWFNGSNRDPLKPVRARMAYDSGFLHGARMFINESGHWGLFEFRDFEGEDHPLCQRYRDDLRKFGEFAEENPRPFHGPEVGIGVVHGNDDGYSGMEGDIWGQPGWSPDSRDYSWELLNVFYPEAGPVASMLGSRDHRRSRFSGTPYGLVDIVPGEAPPEALSRYRSLLFLGWNTMRGQQYHALTEYVRQGGRLVMWAPHLNGSADRADSDVKQRFYRNGDFRELFGVRIKIARHQRGVWRPERTAVNTIRWVAGGQHRFPKGKLYYNNWPHGGVDSELASGVRTLAVTDRGQPFVTEHRLGKGTATLVHCYSPQGQGNFREFAEDIFHAVGERERSPFRIEGNPRLSYALYGRGKRRVLYALNTSVESRETATIVGMREGPRTLRLAPGEMARIDWA